MYRVSSLAAQSKFEILIIDGGSTDETLSVIREYESSISYWVSESDSGQSDAINKGFLRSSGEIVAWLNADDYYLPGAFDSVVDAYRADPSAPFYFGDGLRVDETGAVIANFFPAGTLAFDRQALVMGLNYILQPSTFINRRALEQVGYLDTGLHYGLDSDLWMRLSGLGVPRVVPSVLAATREYATTKTASGSFAAHRGTSNDFYEILGVANNTGRTLLFLGYPSSLRAEAGRFVSRRLFERH